MPLKTLRLSLSLLALIFLYGCSSLVEDASDAEGVEEAEQLVTSAETVDPAELKRRAAMDEAAELLVIDLERALAPVEGKRGAAVLEVGKSEPIVAGYRGSMPQQSVSKLWVAMTIAQMVAQGQAQYSEPITVSMQDRAVFHQPLARRVSTGPVTLTIGDLMHRAITQSDNMANSVLLDYAGGPAPVQTWLLTNEPRVRFGPGDKIMQAAISGLAWDPSYSDRSSFERARGTVSTADRNARYAQYTQNPVDGAETAAMVKILADMRMGRYPGSRDVLALMAKTSTGRSRLKAGLPAGWQLLHKTGTGQTWRGRRAGFNDVGLLETPQGRSYAVAVMIGDSSSSNGVMQTAIANVSRAVGTYDQRTRDCCMRQL